MKVIINKFAIFSVSMLFCGQAFAQSNSPREVIRCSYNSKKGKTYNSDFKVLPKSFFPWGVCFNKPYFREIGGASTTSSREDKWTREAMQVWNTKYDNYKINRWGSNYVIGIPDGPLFVESCDRDEHNIIYTVKANLPDDTLGRYKDVDEFWDWRIFYAIIAMDTHWKNGRPREWTRAYFINVMIHELGHALGIPHLTDESEIMTSHGFGCTKPKLNACDLQSVDFEKFLWPYDPQDAYKGLSLGDRCFDNGNGACIYL